MALGAAAGWLLRVRCVADAVRPPLDFFVGGRGGGGTLFLGAAALVFYLLWLPLGALWASFAALLTTPGAAVATLLALVAAGRLLARALVFPGSLPVIANGLERDVASHLRGRLTEAVAGVDGACRALLAGGGAQAAAALPLSAAAVAAWRAQVAPHVDALREHVTVLGRQADDGVSSPHAAYLAHYLTLLQAACEAACEAATSAAAAPDARAAGVPLAAALRAPAVVPSAARQRWLWLGPNLGSGADAATSDHYHGSLAAFGTGGGGGGDAATAGSVELHHATPLVPLPHLLSLPTGLSPSAPGAWETRQHLLGILQPLQPLAAPPPTAGAPPPPSLAATATTVPLLLSLAGLLRLTRALCAVVAYLLPWTEVVPWDLVSAAHVAALAGYKRPWHAARSALVRQWARGNTAASMAATRHLAHVGGATSAHAGGDASAGGSALAAAAPQQQQQHGEPAAAAAAAASLDDPYAAQLLLRWVGSMDGGIPAAYMEQTPDAPGAAAAAARSSEGAGATTGEPAGGDAAPSPPAPPTAARSSRAWDVARHVAGAALRLCTPFVAAFCGLRDLLRAPFAPPPVLGRDYLRSELMLAHGASVLRVRTRRGYCCMGVDLPSLCGSRGSPDASASAAALHAGRRGGGGSRAAAGSALMRGLRAAATSLRGYHHVEAAYVPAALRPPAATAAWLDAHGLSDVHATLQALQQRRQPAQEQAQQQGSADDSAAVTCHPLSQQQQQQLGGSAGDDAHSPVAGGAPGSVATAPAGQGAAQTVTRRDAKGSGADRADSAGASVGGGGGGVGAGAPGAAAPSPSPQSMWEPIRRCLRGALPWSGGAGSGELGGVGAYSSGLHDPFMRAYSRGGGAGSGGRAGTRMSLAFSGDAPASTSTYRSLSQLRALVGRCPSRALVLLCGPNAGLYEYSHRQGSWLDLYLSLGCDVLLWNYAGYSGSSGVPAPARLARDAQLLVRFLRTELGVARVLVHGESIGGVPACALAAAGCADLLIADRTLDSLPRTARAMMGSVLETALLCVTRWSGSNAAAYLQAGGGAGRQGAAAASTPRLLCVDPSDQVIAWESSLAAGVAERLCHWAPAAVPTDDSAAAVAGDAMASLTDVSVTMPPALPAAGASGAGSNASGSSTAPSVASLLSPQPSTAGLPLLSSPSSRDGSGGRSSAWGAGGRGGNHYRALLARLCAPAAQAGPPASLHAALQPVAARLYFLMLALCEAGRPALARMSAVRSPPALAAFSAAAGTSAAGSASAVLAVLGPAGRCHAAQLLVDAMAAAGSASAASRVASRAEGAHSDADRGSGAAHAEHVPSSSESSSQLPRALLDSALVLSDRQLQLLTPSSSSASSSASRAVALARARGDSERSAAGSSRVPHAPPAAASALTRCLAGYGLHPRADDAQSPAYAMACRWARGQLKAGYTAHRQEDVGALAGACAGVATGCALHERIVCAAADAALPPLDRCGGRGGHAVARSPPAAAGAVASDVDDACSPADAARVLALDSALFSSQAGLTSYSAAAPVEHVLAHASAGGGGGAPPGPAAMLLLALAGCSNGLGHRLGDAVASGAGDAPAGILAVVSFLSAGLLFGWRMQEGWGRGGGGGAAAALAREAARGLARSAADFPAGASGAAGEADEQSRAAQAGGTSAHLRAAREAGLASTLRRVLAMALPLASGAGGGGDASESLALAVEALQLLVEVASLRPAAAHASGVAAVAGAGEGAPAQPSDSVAAAVVAALRAPPGLVVPLGCGHNAPWQPAETALVARALVCFLAQSPGC